MITFGCNCPCKPGSHAHLTRASGNDEAPIVGDAVDCAVGCGCIHRVESVDLTSRQVVLRRIPVDEQLEAMRAWGRDVVTCVCPHCHERQVCVIDESNPLTFEEGRVNLLGCPDCGGPSVATERVDNELAVRECTPDELALVMRDIRECLTRGPSLLDMIGEILADDRPAGRRRRPPFGL